MAHAKFLEKQGKQHLKFNTSHRNLSAFKDLNVWIFFFLITSILRVQLVGAVQKTLSFYVQLNTVANFHRTNYTVNLLVLF